MNAEHSRDSSGLPLRAMVMVLLFLGVIFLLVGFQALNSGGDSDDDGTAVASTTTSVADKPVVTGTPKVEVQVYNNTFDATQDGLAADTAAKLKAEGWTVSETDNIVLDWLDETTVFYDPDVAGEREAAEQVAELVGTERVESRQVDDPDIADKPPGLIVVLAG